MPSYRTDVSGFPVLTSEDGSDPVAQDEPYDAKAPAVTPARGVAGFGAGASNGTPGPAGQAG